MYTERKKWRENRSTSVTSVKTPYMKKGVQQATDAAKTNRSVIMIFFWAKMPRSSMIAVSRMRLQCDFTARIILQYKNTIAKIGNMYTTLSRKTVCDISEALCGYLGPHMLDDDLYTISVHPRMGPTEHAKADNHTRTMINKVRFRVIILLRGLTIEKYLCILITVSVKIDEENQKGTTNAFNLHKDLLRTQDCFISAVIMNGMQNKHTPMPVTANCVRKILVLVRICRLQITTPTTSAFPRKPATRVRNKTTSCSNTIVSRESASTSFVDELSSEFV